MMIKLLKMATVSIVILENYMGDISSANAQQPLYLAYPPNNHQTTSDKIFLIGTASSEGKLFINGQEINRNQAGHFAPSFPLNVGKNHFIIRYKKEEIKLTINRISLIPEIPQGVTFASQSLTPKKNIARLPGEKVCFSAIAPKDATVLVKISNQVVSLIPEKNSLDLPPNSGVLIDQNLPILTNTNKYKGCTVFSEFGQQGTPLFELSLNNQTMTKSGVGTVEILSPYQTKIVEITANQGVARTGPSTNYSRMTPLPKGTIAAITGKEGEWFRLDYGAWIKRDETRVLGISSPPKTLIKSIKSEVTEQGTKIIFPLQIPVPLTVHQESNKIVLSLYNTIAQTDIIKFPLTSFINNFTWQQVTPTQTEYTFELTSNQQWGYDLQYEGTNLIFLLRNPPKIELANNRPLVGIKILLDPGHGGEELGAKGPNGYPEKSVNLTISKLLKNELIKRGATVYTTRETDKFVSLQERVNLINQLKPTLSLSIHYNALPDGGDALNTAGIGMFWYHPQAQNLSVFLHNYLTQKLNRPSYGVFWNNLALTRPHITPSILLELGFMINPDEFEWIINPTEQEKLAQTLADGITEWFRHLYSREKMVIE